MKTAKELKELYNTSEFRRTYTYDQKNLGAVCTEEGTSFLLWSPLARKVELCLYRDGEQGECFRKIAMQKKEYGVWEYRTEEYLHGVYYDFLIDRNSEQVQLGDPYARACGINGMRSMAVDLKKTDPEGWEMDRAPEKTAENIIYELHVKEFSWDRSGGFCENCRGKYTAFLQEHTTLNGDGIHPTGIDYLKELGVTHVQIMPAYDYGSVDEKNNEEFNWGYDPVNYNVPEGSYSTDPAHGEVRIQEFKQMVQSLHRNGFRVIMDVVYNHTFSLESNLHKAAPWYYHRTDENGIISNGSACGNDVASERAMCSNYIADSVLYWAKEYHIDGFRFDLMGLLDVDLMNRIRKELDDLYGKGEKLLFGEPWAADETAMEGNSIPALKKNIRKLDENVGMFSDDIRDSIKGHVFEGDEPGFVNGAPDMEEKILNSVKAWCLGDEGAKAPSQIISYISAHDNWTLWDKLEKTTPDEAERLERNKLAAAVYMTCQGSLFFLSGEEFARTKDGEENSYNAPIELNRLDWERAYQYSDLRRYYQGLIALRKQLPGLCDKSANAGKRIFGQWKRDGAAGFYVENQENKGTEESAACCLPVHSGWKTLAVVYNRTEKPVSVLLPEGEEGEWEVLVDKNSSFCWMEDRKVSKKATAAPVSALILGKK
ncbi:MAG: type I pullulanase [Lachnospiraceae bacterium]|nr:type I pullulanase [Lachnospiraceae bacterium]